MRVEGIFSTPTGQEDGYDGFSLTEPDVGLLISTYQCVAFLISL